MLAPELPLIAEGDWPRLASPPSPPFALTSAIESPAATRPTLARLFRPRTAILALTSPARPYLAVPLSPELPVTACGSAIAVEEAGPVLPVLVDDDCAHEVPESPDWAHGDWVRLASPPFPPLTLREAIESPPLMRPTFRRLLRPERLMRARALPARSDRTVPRSPPSPPLPPSTVPATAL